MDGRVMLRRMLFVGFVNEDSHRGLYIPLQVFWPSLIIGHIVYRNSLPSPFHFGRVSCAGV